MQITETKEVLSTTSNTDAVQKSVTVVQNGTTAPATPSFNLSMLNVPASVTTDVVDQTFDFVASQQNEVALGSADYSRAMCERIQQLSAEANAWETNVLANSNATLYGLLQKAYGLYLDMTDSMDNNLLHKEQGLVDYLSLNGMERLASKPLSKKIIACVFGSKRDRRRIHTYNVVLRHIISQKWALADVPAKITAAGGVQEISLEGSTGTNLTATDKVAAARQQVNQAVLAKVHSPELGKLFNPEKTGEQFAAVLTQEADGSFSINCVVESTTAVNAALAAYFSANKKALKQSTDQQQAEKANATVSELKDAAVNYPLAA
jgi:hypothetical protein